MVGANWMVDETTISNNSWSTESPLSSIDWNLLNLAIKYYTEVGFKYIEVPWVVPDYIAEYTFKDKDKLNTVTAYGRNKGTLVGSAEQSFLSLLNDGHRLLEQGGRFVACTPCFRQELKFDDLHKFTFMKVELFVNLPDHTQQFMKMIEEAEILFDALAHPFSVHQELTPEGFDLYLGNIEVGSYGKRQAIMGGKNIEWVYGTGLALPRFSQAVHRCKTNEEEKND